MHITTVFIRSRVYGITTHKPYSFWTDSSLAMILYKIFLWFLFGELMEIYFTPIFSYTSRTQVHQKTYEFIKQFDPFGIAKALPFLTPLVFYALMTIILLNISHLTSSWVKNLPWKCEGGPYWTLRLFVFSATLFLLVGLILLLLP
ncbi:MAG: hypothetical protein ABFQ62_00525 [Patescibacteria group bacterium]